MLECGAGACVCVRGWEMGSLTSFFFTFEILFILN